MGKGLELNISKRAARERERRRDRWRERPPKRAWSSPPPLRVLLLTICLPYSYGMCGGADGKRGMNLLYIAQDDRWVNLVREQVGRRSVGVYRWLLSLRGIGCLSSCTPVCPPICLSVNLPMYVSVYVHTHSIYPSLCPSIVG